MAAADPAVRPDGADAALLRVRLVPRAARSALAGRHDGALKVRVAAPPVEGRANAALLDLLADVLGVRARDLAVVAGATSRDKVVRVAGRSPADVAEALRRAGAG